MVDLSKFVEVLLNEQDDFLKVRETLTRIGVSSRKEKVLYQSCHILHKQGKYYIVHFKELFALDGKPSNISENDIQRRNAIANLLEEWGLIKVLNKDILVDNIAPLHHYTNTPLHHCYDTQILWWGWPWPASEILPRCAWSPPQ